MDISLLIELVNSLGLPSVIIGCSFWYINRKDQMHAAEIDSWRNKDDTSDERLIGSSPHAWGCFYCTIHSQ